MVDSVARMTIWSGQLARHNHGDGAVGAVMRNQRRRHLVEHMDRQMDCECRAGRGIGGEAFADGIAQARPEVRVSTTVCATPGSVSSRPSRLRRRRMTVPPA